MAPPAGGLSRGGFLFGGGSRFPKTMAHISCLTGPIVAVLCAIQDISLRVEQGMCPGDAFGEDWACRCLVGKGGFVD